MSGRSFHIVAFRVLRPPDLFPRTWSASYLRGSGVAHIIIIFVIRIVGASISHFLVNVVGLLFLAWGREQSNWPGIFKVGGFGYRRNSANGAS